MKHQHTYLAVVSCERMYMPRHMRDGRTRMCMVSA